MVGGNAAFLSMARWSTVAAYGKNAVWIPGVETVGLDLEDETAIRTLIRTSRPGAVLHCAAWSNLDACESDRAGTFRINTEAVGILAETCFECRSRLVFTSTDMVFDGEKGNYSEADAVRPLSVYGESKVAAENNIRAVCPDHAIARVALVYGKPATGGSSFSEKILQTWREGGRAMLFKDQFRTPIEVRNLAEALLELVWSDFTGTIHLGGPDRLDRYAFGLLLAGRKGVPAHRIVPAAVTDVSAPARRPLDASLDISRAKSVLKTHLLGCREGMERT